MLWDVLLFPSSTTKGIYEYIRPRFLVNLYKYFNINSSNCCWTSSKLKYSHPLSWIHGQVPWILVWRILYEKWDAKYFNTNSQYDSLDNNCCYCCCCCCTNTFTTFIRSLRVLKVTTVCKWGNVENAQWENIKPIYEWKYHVCCVKITPRFLLNVNKLWKLSSEL